jgi:hypothetical protein
MRFMLMSFHLRQLNISKEKRMTRLWSPCRDLRQMRMGDLLFTMRQVKVDEGSHRDFWLQEVGLSSRPLLI